jgi:outer membrane lipoprotein carrier protein
MKRVLLSALVLLCSLPAVAGNPVDSIVQTLERHYNRLQTLKANFTQIYKQDATAPARQEWGTLYLKKPGKMRWEYASPEVKLFLSDGKTVYFYVPEDRQVTRVPAKDSADLRTPLRFLLGRMDLKREFRVEAAHDVAPLDPGNDLLLLLPKKSGERFRELLIEVDRQERIRRLKITDTDGAITEFRLSGEIGDPPLDSKMFEFKPPPGVEVVDQRGQ